MICCGVAFVSGDSEEEGREDDASGVSEEVTLTSKYGAGSLEIKIISIF